MENSANKIMEIVKISAIFVTLITPFLYLIGLGHYQGVLSGFGIPSSVFPLGFEAHLVMAYYYFINLMFGDLDLIEVIPIIILISVVFLLLLDRPVRRFWQFLAGKIKIFFDEKEKEVERIPISDFSRKSLSVLENANILFLILIIFCAWPVLAFLEGRGQSKELIEKHKKDGCIYDAHGWNKCVKIMDADSGTLITEGILIVSSKERIAIHTKGNSYILPYSENYQIVRELSKIKDE